MKVAVLGAGFAGLAVCYYALQEGHEVTVYDPNGIGGGASGLAAGLLHAYVGEKALKSRFADDAIPLSQELLERAAAALGKPVCVGGGIERYALSDEQKQEFGEKWLIEPGITVFGKSYLEGLAKACIGAQFINEKLPIFAGYDRYVIALGSAIADLPCDLPLYFVKGQILICKRPPWLTRSIIAKGYIALHEDPSLCFVGSTYERQFTSAEPNLEEAKQLILPKLFRFLPFKEELDVIECKSAIRVMNRHDYTPLMRQIGPHTWVLTAMGSRGLLYHAYYAKQLVREL